MVNRYETLKKTENFKTLIALGVIPITTFDWLTIYEWYLNERKLNTKMQSYQNTADSRKPAVSEKHVRNIVKWMESN